MRNRLYDSHFKDYFKLEGLKSTADLPYVIYPGVPLNISSLLCDSLVIDLLPFLRGDKYTTKSRPRSTGRRAYFSLCRETKGEKWGRRRGIFSAHLLHCICGLTGALNVYQSRGAPGRKDTRGREENEEEASKKAAT